jgi:hypothetical protein
VLLDILSTEHGQSKFLLSLEAETIITLRTNNEAGSLLTGLRKLPATKSAQYAAEQSFPGFQMYNLVLLRLGITVSLFHPVGYVVALRRGCV